MEYVEKENNIYIINQKSRTRRIIKLIERHKFITMAIAMFISFSVLNAILIAKFFNLLSEINYIH